MNVIDRHFWHSGGESILELTRTLFEHIHKDRTYMTHNEGAVDTSWIVQKLCTWLPNMLPNAVTYIFSPFTAGITLLAGVGTTPHTMLVGFLAVWFVMLIYSSACTAVSFVKHVIRRMLFLPPFKGLFHKGLILYKVWTIQEEYVFFPTS